MKPKPPPQELKETNQELLLKESEMGNTTEKSF